MKDCGVICDEAAKAMAMTSDERVCKDLQEQWPKSPEEPVSVVVAVVGCCRLVKSHPKLACRP